MDDSQQFWQGHVAAREASGETQKLYCARHGLAPRTFQKWRAKLGNLGVASENRTSAPEDVGKGRARDLSSAPLGATLEHGLPFVDLITPNSRVRRQWSPEEKQEVVLALLRSGLSIERFARGSGIASSMVHRWKQQLVPGVGQQNAPARQLPTSDKAAGTAFATVRLAPPRGDERPSSSAPDTAAVRDMVEVTLTNGRRLRFHLHADPATLNRLLAVLEAGT